MMVPRRPAWSALAGFLCFVASATGASRADSSGPTRSPGIDLLKMIDPLKDAVAGTWRFQDGKLVTPGRPFDRIRIPYTPPEEYDLTVVADRQGESNSLNLGLVAGQTQFLVILDAAINGDFVSGLDLVDGKSFYDNETRSKGALFKNGETSKVACCVRKSRLSVFVDGKKVIDWKADYSRLSLYSGWKTREKNTLLLGSWSSVVRIHRLELRPVTGTGKALRPN